MHNRDQAKRADLNRGDQFYQKGAYSDAEIQFRKALTEDPRFGEAFLELGRTESKLGKYSLAYDSLREAGILMPGEDAPKTELGNLLLVGYLANPGHPAYLYAQISEISGQLLNHDANSFEGIRLRAYLATTDSDSSKAVDYFEKANRLRPDQPDVITAWCQSLMRTGSKDRAEKIARDFLQRHPSYGPLYSMLYEYYLQSGRKDQAEAILRSKVANNPTEGLYRIELARHYARSGRTAEMLQVLNQLLSAPKTFPQARLDIGDFYMENGNWSEARKYYEDGAQTDRKLQITYLKRLVRLDLATKNQAAALDSIGQILKIRPDDTESQASQAALRMASGDPAQRRLAISDFKAIVDRLPDAVDYRYQYAEALRTDGQNEAARQQYLIVIQRQPGHLSALQALADLSIHEERIDEALGFANRILAIKPGDPSATLVQTAALAVKGRFGETRSALNDLTKEHPDIRETQLQLALLDAEQKRYPQAEERFRKLYIPGKGDVRSLEGLVEVYRAQNQIGRAVVLLKQDLEKGPQFDQVRALLAKTAVQAGMKELAVSEYEQLAHTQPGSGPIALELGLAYQTNGDLVRAIGEFERAKKLAPQIASVHAFLGKALAESGRKDEAISSYRRSLALDGNNPWVMSNLAFLLADIGSDLGKALSLAQSAVRDVPSDPSFADTVGFIYLKEKDFQSAIHTFQEVTDKRPKDAGFRIHLGQALLASGNLNQGKAELEAALKLSSNSKDRERIEEILRRDQPDK